MKSSIKKTGIAAVLFISLLALNISASAQCNSVTIAGIKKLAPYTHNGQINNATIKAGKTVEVHLSFYKGLYYKLQISSEDAVGKVSFRVLDENKTEVYNSSGASQPDSWNFYSNSSQELTIEVKSAENSKKGCVAVVVGMQVPKNNNPIRNL